MASLPSGSLSIRSSCSASLVTASKIQVHNQVMLGKLVVFSLLMFGFGYAMVPLYEKICQVTGINNLLNPEDTSDFKVDSSRKLRFDLDANVRGNVSFRPLTRTMRINPGATYSVIYEIENNLDRELHGQAIPSFAPTHAQRYVKKLECFCFYQMTLEPREAIRLPVVFSLDPNLDSEINTIAMSYTFFEIEGAR